MASAEVAALLLAAAAAMRSRMRCSSDRISWKEGRMDASLSQHLRQKCDIIDDMSIT
jgi:hypothetical protein